MSESLRVAVAAEGPTDFTVLEAILEAILTVEFRLDPLQPERSAAFGAKEHGSTGVGWGGVYRWIRQAREEGGGAVSGSSVFDRHDVLIVHVDADVATKTYASASIKDAPRDDLPCNMPCPPASDTTNALRAVVLNWLGEASSIPPNLVMCTPSMKMDAWVIAAVAPSNAMVLREDWECRVDPDSQLTALPRSQRFEKTQNGYRGKYHEIMAGWHGVTATLTEAARFQEDFLSVLSGHEGNANV